jgi:hypothetical protein
MQTDIISIGGDAMDEKRKFKRLILDDNTIANYRGAACFIVDACASGLGITFISNSGWPQEIDLNFTLPQESDKERYVPCRTVWESSMGYYKTGSKVTVRRRGLEFIDPESENASRLFDHLSVIGIRPD